MEILSVALSAANALAGLHGAGVIHRDISATNLLVDEHGAVQLIDLGLATPRSQATAAFSGVGDIVGTLRYMAPEQTGRMNRPVDARSDLYAIGAVLYELFTGEPPFTTDDTLELIHAHLAQTPTPPHQKNPEVPEPVSRIVLKLLAKDPEDRYQTAAGLVADLQRCRTSLETTGRIERFALGAHDVVEDLRMPDRLYGRDAEVSRILSAFELAASGGRLLLLVQGDPGIGKSCLVREAHPAITRARGLFVEGKFDQYQRFVPYTALTQAFTALTDLILAEPEEALNACRDRMQSALGELGQVVLDVVPALERIIGPQPEAPLLDGHAVQNRLRYRFARWVSSMASPDHPLVLFVDDMQWADVASLDLLKAILVAPDISGLLVVAAYRDNEVDEAHPFQVAIQELQNGGVRLDQLRLDNLETGHVAELLADTFATDQDIPELAQVICDKTLGNPFFTKRFVQNLVDEEHVRFDQQNRQWQWSLNAIGEAALADNVVDLLAGQLEQLPPPVRRLLEVAACIGNPFDPQVLTALPNVEVEAAAERLELAVTRGFVTERNGYYRFIHDRVQQTAHSLMSPQERAWVHLHIGRLLLGQADEATLDQRVLDIVDHLNVASHLLQTPEEWLELAALNLRATRTAGRASAFVAGLKYAEAGLALLPADIWELHYDLSLGLHEQAALLAPIVGDIERMEHHTRLVIDHAQDDVDTARVLKNKIKFLAASGQHNEALNIGFEALEALGLPMPKNPSWDDAVDRIRALDAQLGDADPRFAEMRTTPTDQDRRVMAVLELVEAMSLSAYVSRQALGPIVIVIYVELCLQQGLLTLDFPPFYTIWGGFLIGVLDKPTAARDAFERAHALATTPAFRSSLGHVLDQGGNFILPWVQHLRETLDTFLRAYRILRDNGDVYSAAGVISPYCRICLLASEPLAEWVALVLKLRQFPDAMGFRQQSDWVNNSLSTAYVLQGQTGVTITSWLDEPPLKRDGIEAALIHLRKAYVATLFRAHDAIAREIELSAAFIHMAVGMVDSAVFTFIRGLHTAREVRVKSEPLDAVDADLAALDKWAAHAPMNFRHKYDLVDAERRRALGDVAGALRAYEAAITGASAHGYLNEMGLACELAAEFYADLSLADIAALYFQKAIDAYRQWGGAQALVERLTTPKGASEIAGAPVTGTSTSGFSHAAIDMASVTRAARAIASELEVERLLPVMMQLVLEYAGGRKGVFLMEEAGEWRPVARAAVKADGIDAVLISESDTERFAAPDGMIRVVARTRKMVVCDDVRRNPHWQNEPYFRSHDAKSVLCKPIVSHGEMGGVLLLENDLADAAFQESHLKALDILVGNLQSLQLKKVLDAMQQRHRLLIENAKLREDVERITRHDLKAPLTGIIKFPTLILRNPDNLTSDQIELTTMIHEAGLRMLHLINRSAELYKMEQGAYELRPERFDLVKSIRDIQNENRAEIEHKNLSLTVEIDGNVDSQSGFEIYGEELLCYSMLGNLMKNAVEASPVGGTIEVRLARKEGYHISITNRGSVPEELRDTFFEKYQSAKAGGMGLGTYSAKLIAQTHGGSIDLHTEVDDLTIIDIRLPLERSDRDASQGRSQ